MDFFLSNIHSPVCVSRKSASLFLIWQLEFHLVWRIISPCLFELHACPLSGWSIAFLLANLTSADWCTTFTNRVQDSGSVIKTNHLKCKNTGGWIVTHSFITKWVSVCPLKRVEKKVWHQQKKVSKWEKVQSFQDRKRRRKSKIQSRPKSRIGWLVFRAPIHPNYFQQIV